MQRDEIFCALYGYVEGNFSKHLHSMLEIFHSSPLIATITVGGFNPLAAIFGLITFFQVSQFIYYGFDANDPSND